MRIGARTDAPAFCGMGQIAAYAARRGLSQKKAMAELLARDVWPERFRRHLGILSATAQIRLLDLPVLIAGCGGLGGAVAALLARLGAGDIRLCDYDRFEESNLNRQRFCDETTLGRPKAEVVAQGLRALASFGDYTAVIRKLTPENLPEILSDREIVVDCLDSVAGKKMLEKAAKEAGIAWLHGSVLRDEAFVCLSTPAGGLLTKLYRDESQPSGAGSVFGHVVSGAASLMVSLFVAWLMGKRPNSHLLRADFSAPELDAFQVE